MARCERRFHEPPNLEPLHQNVPWVHVIVACVEFALSTLDPVTLVMHRPLGADLERISAELPKGMTSVTSGGHCLN